MAILKPDIFHNQRRARTLMTPAEAQAKQKEAAVAVFVTPSFGKRKPTAAPPPKLHVVTPPESTPSPTQQPQVKAVPEQQNIPEAESVHTGGVLPPYLNQSLEVIWKTLRQTVDARQISRLGRAAATMEIMLSVEMIAQHNDLNLSKKELQMLGNIVADEMLGLGPLEPLLARDDISEIMVNGPNTVYVEVNGLVERSPVIFRDNDQLVAVCQRIATQVGRRVDDSKPICDARLPDGSRVNIVLPPLSLDGATLTIRKFKRDRLTLEKLLEYSSIDKTGAELIKIIAGCRTNVLVSGGTGSGKTTLLNCLTRYIHPRERIITCEDSAELQLQQPHVVRMETRMANLEGAGEVSMRDLVKNCLRMRPERIIVGEVRGPEAFDLLQAMNTGHDGSMGTVHANSPREAISRIESMIAMNRLNIPAEAVRAQIAASINIIVQVQRLHDGSRKVTSISEITGMEQGVISMQELIGFHMTGEDARGRITGEFRPTGLRPKFYAKLREFGLEQRFNDLMETYFLR
jgi:pilus assembly protein CpaF